MDGAKAARAVKAGRSSCDEGRMVFFIYFFPRGGCVVVMVRGREC